MPPQRAESPVRIGVDAVSARRVEEVIGTDAERRRSVFTERELEHCRGRRRESEHLAARFAAKEAVLKALGTGVTRGVRLTDVEVVNERSGRPRIVLTGAAARHAEAHGLSAVEISLTHTEGLAIATAVASQGPTRCDFT